MGNTPVIAPAKAIASPAELLPCPNPWCESHQYERGGPQAPDDLLEMSGSNGLRVGCAYCSIMGPVRATEAEAIAAWNTRAPDHPSQAQARIERLRGALQEAAWKFAQIGTMHSIDDASAENVAERCMELGQQGYREAKAALAEPQDPPHTLGSAAGTRLADHEGVKAEKIEGTIT